MDNSRDLETGVRRDFTEAMSYSDYLRLDLILNAQQPLSDPFRHDEMLFIIQHQTSELWLKLMLHELRATQKLLDADDLHLALKCLARVKTIQGSLIEQWRVLSTLTPSEYAKFRGYLQSSSGFQSWQYRAIEFILGNKNEQMLQVFEHDPTISAEIVHLYESPTLYDSFLRYLARHGHPIPQEILDRDVREGWRLQTSLVPVFDAIYLDPAHHWREYEACETLVDLEDNFQLWRFRHLKTVERIIGSSPGSGGSSGVPFLRKALDLTFFPELYALRTDIVS